MFIHGNESENTLCEMAAILSGGGGGGGGVLINNSLLFGRMLYNISRVSVWFFFIYLQMYICNIYLGVESYST